MKKHLISSAAAEVLQPGGAILGGGLHACIQIIPKTISQAFIF